MKNKQLRALCEGAIMVALAQVLGYIKISPLPSGGSVSFVMLPIFIYCARWGFARGLIASFALGALQFLLDGGFAIGWQSIIGDYILAYGVLGIAGLFSRKKYGFFYGVAIGTVARFLVAWVVGATIWAEYMPEKFFGLSMSSPWIYSALYNGSYILLCAALYIVVGMIFYKPMEKFLRGEDLR